MIVFFDTSIFSKDVPRTFLENLLKNPLIECRVTWPIFKELQKSLKVLSKKVIKECHLDLLFDHFGKLSNNLELIDLENLRKRNPLFCLRYYGLLSNAYNPAVFHKPYKFLHNLVIRDASYGIESEENINKAIKKDGERREKEAKFIKKIQEKMDNVPFEVIRPEKVIKKRKERIKNIQKGKSGLEDYKNSILVFLYSCITGKPCFILCGDRDYIEIADNISESLVEEYSRTNIVLGQIRKFNRSQRKEYINGYTIMFNVSIDKYFKEIGKTYKKINHFVEKVEDKINRCMEEIYGNLDAPNKKIYKKISRFKGAIFGITYFSWPSNSLTTKASMEPPWFADFVINYCRGMNCLLINQPSKKYNTFVEIWQPSKDEIVFKIKKTTEPKRIFTSFFACDRCRYLTENPFSFYPEIDIKDVHL